MFVVAPRRVKAARARRTPKLRLCQDPDVHRDRDATQSSKPLSLEGEVGPQGRVRVPNSTGHNDSMDFPRIPRPELHLVFPDFRMVSPEFPGLASNELCDLAGRGAYPPLSYASLVS